MSSQNCFKINNIHTTGGDLITPLDVHWQDSLARPVTARNSARPFAKKLLVAGLYGCLAWSSVALAQLPGACETEYQDASGNDVSIGGPQDPKGKLTGCWPLDTDLKAGTAPDGTKYGPDGALNAKGTATFGTFEDQDAMFFNGNTFVKIDSIKGTDSSGKGYNYAFHNQDFTFAIWATIPTNGRNHQLMKLSAPDGYPSAGLIKRPQGNHNGRFVVLLNNGTQQTYVYSDQPGGAFPNDTWIHIAGVFKAPTTSDSNDGRVTLYVNGAKEDEFTKRKGFDFDFDSNAGAKNVALRIGASGNNTNPIRHIGWLYDARIYNRALTEEEIKLIAGNTKQVNHSDPCQAHNDPDRSAEVVFSAPPKGVGRWDDPNTWSPAGVPDGKWVIIRSGDVISAPEDSATTCEDADFTTISVAGLCVEKGAKLRSAAKGRSVSIAADFLNNKGTIRGRDRNWPGGDDVCIGDGFLEWFQNTGTIQSGNVITAYTQVNGGDVEIHADTMLNMGNILSGNGTHGACYNNTVVPAGRGGNILIEPDNVPEKLTNRGTIRSGVGGSFFFTHCSFPVNQSAAGGRVVFNGAGQKGRVGHHGAWLWVDPIEMTFSNETQIIGSDVFIVTDDKGTIQANDLQPGAVSAEKVLTLAVGAGGTIDLSKAADKAFKAGEEIRIFADNLILPEGKTLADFVDAPKLTQAGGKTIYAATWTDEGAKVAGDPNTSVSLPLTLLNAGPTTDSYTFSIQNTLGWTLCSLPTTITLDSQAKTSLNCAVTLPATTEVDNTITVTATSKNDPTMQAISEITVHVGPVPEETVGDDLELPPPTFTASSVILDGDQQPVMDVTVQIGDQTTTTDDSGYWDITELPEGTYPVTVTKDGYTFDYEKEVIIGNGDLTLSIVAHSLLAMKVECPNLIDQGAEISCQYTITNQGSDNTTGIALTLEPSPNITLTSLTGEQVNCSTFAAPYSCTLPDLAPGAVAKVTMVANNSGFETLENKFIETKAMLSSTNYPTETVITEIDVRPHLWIETKCKPNPVPIQGQLQCVVTVHLNEKATEVAESVEVSLPKTPGVAVQTIQPSAGQCDTEDPRDIICALGNLAQGAESTITLDLQLEDVGLLMFRQQATVSAENYPGDAGSGVAEIFVPEDIKADVVIVLDTTSSMQKELDNTIAASEDFIAAQPTDKKLTWALVEFKDDVRIKAFTQDPQILVKALEGLTVEGGGLCSEASAEALEIALKHVKDGGTILLATDASPYPEADLTKLGDLLKQKNVKFHALISGDCAMSGGVN
ncbi:MAG: hypothetical protein BWK78_04875 [Thiotrichaceae bacterium IS1]|nr:MAG: hypothetical protein BWK78_04875 [Thiotrichaceae bacterium IS1]